MILLHRIRGEPFHLNDDLIEAIEATPDTVLSLKDGRRLVVQESPDEVVDAIRIFRASILATADQLVVSRGGSLIAFPGGRRDDQI
jgi:flagellar protein FlbD